MIKLRFEVLPADLFYVSTNPSVGNKTKKIIPERIPEVRYCACGTKLCTYNMRDVCENCHSKQLAIEEKRCLCGTVLLPDSRSTECNECAERQKTRSSAPPQMSKQQFEKIIRRTAELYDVSFEKLMISKSSRNAKVTRARYALMFVLNVYCKFSQTHIAEHWQCRNATVSAAVKKIKIVFFNADVDDVFLQQEKELRNTVRAILAHE